MSGPSEIAQTQSSRSVQALLPKLWKLVTTPIGSEEPQDVSQRLITMALVLYHSSTAEKPAENPLAAGLWHTSAATPTASATDSSTSQLNSLPNLQGAVHLSQDVAGLPKGMVTGKGRIKRVSDVTHLHPWQTALRYHGAMVPWQYYYELTFETERSVDDHPCCFCSGLLDVYVRLCAACMRKHRVFIVGVHSAGSRRLVYARDGKPCDKVHHSARCRFEQRRTIGPRTFAGHDCKQHDCADPRRSDTDAGHPDNTIGRGANSCNDQATDHETNHIAVNSCHDCTLLQSRCLAFC